MAWNLVPVEGDPFKAPPAGGSGGWKFEPVQGDPFATKVAQAETLPDEPADTSDQSYAGALANAAIQGAVGGVGQAVQGVGEIPRGLGNRAATSLLEMMDRVDRGERAPNPLATPPQIIQYQGASPERRAELRAKIAGLRQEAATAPPNALMEAGRDISANVQQDNPVSPTQEGFGTGVARSAGSLVTALPTMIIGGAAGGPAGAALGASAVIWPQTYAGTLEQARAKGVPEEQAVSAAMANATAQAGIMSLPVARVFGRIPAAFREPFANTLVNLTKGGIEFGSLTALGKFADNYVAQQTFDPERPLTQGVADATMEGAFLGALIPLGGTVAHGVTEGARRAVAPMADANTRELARAQQVLADIAQGKQPEPPPPPSAESPPPPAPGGEPPAMRSALNVLDDIAAGTHQQQPELKVPEVETPPAEPTVSAPPATIPPTAEISQPPAAAAPEVQVSAPPEPTIPPAPTRIRTLAEIQQVDGVGPREAQRIQTAEIEAIGRPISAEDMAARKAGVSTAPPPRAEVPSQPETPLSQPEDAVSQREGAPSQPEAAEPFRAFTPSGAEITLRPELVDLSQLVPSNHPDGRVNPAYPAELQPRDRSQAASQAQVQEIAGNLRPELLAPGPDVTTGAPIIGPDGAVESGNGRVMALTRVLTDPALRPKRDAYMAWLESQGYDTAGLQNPVLVSRRVSDLAPEQRPVFAIEANDRTNMAMSPAEAARADATRAAQAMNLWEGTSATSASNRGFVRAFMAALPATERGRMVDANGNLSPDGADRISRAVMAHAYGDEAGAVLNRFLNSESEGMKAVAGAMQDMAGSWAQLRAAAERGDIPRSLDITRPLVEAVETLAEARRLGRSVKDVLSQVDFEKPPVSAEAVGILRNFFRDDGMRQPAGRKPVADFLAEYAARAQKQRPAILEGHTISDPTEIMRSLRGDAPKGQEAMFAAREAKVAEEHAAAQSKGQPEEVKQARELLYRTMQAFMRYVGLPPRVGLKLVDRLLDGGADASYRRGLIEFAMDTPPGEVPLKLFHEVIHALVDPKLGLLTPAEHKALNLAAERWLKKPENEAALKKAYPKADRAILREEAVARLAEEALSYGMKEPPAVLRAARNMRNFVVGVGQALRGQGFRTSDDVFRSLLHGEREGQEGVPEGPRAAPEEPAKQSAREPEDDALFAARNQGRLPLATERKNLAKDVVDNLQRWLSPTSRPGADAMEAVVRRSAAERAQSAAKTGHALDKLVREIDRLPEAEQLDVWHKAETRQPQANPELQRVVDGTRKELDGWTAKIQQLGRLIDRPLLREANADYMGRAYSNYDEWSRGEAPLTPPELRDKLRQQYAAMQAKAPISGSGAFLKQRTFATLKEAMDAGLIPVTTNPVRMQFLKLLEMQKFYHGTTLGEAIKQSHMAAWVPHSQESAAKSAGWEKLEDRLFQPRLPTAKGPAAPGAYYAPEPVARVFNNYVSQGLAGRSPIYDTIRQVGNALNMAQLGLSGFHATFVTADTMISAAARGIDQAVAGAAKGNIKEAAAGLGHAAIGMVPGINLVTGTVPTIIKGAKLRNWYLGDPAMLPPEARKMVQALNTAGGRIQMDGFHNADQRGAFIRDMDGFKRLFTNPGDFGREIKAMAKETPLLALPFRVVGRVLQTTTEPLMGWLVPRAKLGVFYGMAEDFSRQNPHATPEETAKALIKAWDSVDNRLGQLVYDNLFWSKTLKDTAFIATRSVGWNVGTVREIGGAAVDTARMAKEVATLGKPEWTRRMSYALALPLVVAPYGALITYLNTGAAPQDKMDYFFPPDGKGGRLSLPTYAKDVLEWVHAPFQTAVNKTHPLLSTLNQLRTNRDFYGGIIKAPDENAATAYGNFLAGQVLPFSYRGSQRLGAQGASPLEQALAFWGITPAPGFISHPERGEAFQRRDDLRALRTREKNINKGNAIRFFGP